MLKKISAVLAIVMLFVCVFAACDKSAAPQATVVGAWNGVEKDVGVTYTFNADGTGKRECQGVVRDLTYTIEGDEITITIDSTHTVEDMLSMTAEELISAGLVTQEDIDALITTATYPFSINENTLTIGDSTYTKVN